MTEPNQIIKAESKYIPEKPTSVNDLRKGLWKIIYFISSRETILIARIDNNTLII
jgi:hypothetical protein